MKKKILFICKHNLFRSRVAEEFFKKFNRNKNWEADSAGIIKWEKAVLRKEGDYQIEKRMAKKFGIDIYYKSKSLQSSILNKTNVVIIVADDVAASIFNDRSFKGKILTWKTKDVRPGMKNKKKVAEESINFIKKKVENYIRGLK